MLVFTAAALASALSLPPAPTPLADAGPAPVPGARAIAVDPAAVSRLASRPHWDAVVLPSPSGEPVLASLSRRDAFTSDAKVVLGSEAGDVVLPRPDVVLFGGELEGSPDSIVFLAFTGDHVQGFVRDAGRTWVFSSGPASELAEPVLYDLGDMPENVLPLIAMPCGTDLLPERARALVRSGGSVRVAPCRAAVVAIETDWEYTRDVFGGNTSNAGAYAAVLIAGVSEIYKKEFNASVSIGYLRLWASDVDPYTGNSSWDRIFQFQDYWNANMTAITRDAAHLLSALRDGQIGGVAYYPGLCQTDYDYGLSAYLNGYFPHPLRDHDGQNWDIMVCAHELGHNFGAPHTHDLTPPIDGCGLGDCSQASTGTIMSYCHTCAGGMTNIALTMHPRMVAEQILPYLAEAPCPLTGDPPSILHDPLDVYVDAGEPAEFSVLAFGPEEIRYQWFHDGVAIDGATADTYTITSTITSDAGVYRCAVSSGCATAWSAEALLTVNGSCISDFDGDGFTTGDDFDAYVAAFEAGSLAADTNHDGFTTGDDFDSYVAAFELGC